jgi:cytidine deaminase
MAAPTDSESPLDDLIFAARRVAEAAWCPYSRFAVGAALLTQSGRIVAGCNVENASSGLTICAERNAVFQAVAEGERSFQRLVVYTPTPEPTSPCGACRQVLAEFAPTLPVVCVCDGPGRLETSLSELLPHAFGPESMNPAVSPGVSGSA